MARARSRHDVMVDRVKVDGGVALCVCVDTGMVEAMEDTSGCSV